MSSLTFQYLCRGPSLLKSFALVSFSVISSRVGNGSRALLVAYLSLSLQSIKGIKVFVDILLFLMRILKLVNLTGLRDYGKLSQNENNLGSPVTALQRY